MEYYGQINDPILAKLARQNNPTIVFSDIDGTLFTSNIQIINAPFYNLQTASYLKIHAIPLILVTGRSYWRSIDKYHVQILGIPKPDAIITANGTIIFYLQNNHYIIDFAWEGLMHATKIIDSEKIIKPWNKTEITQTITDYLHQKHFSFSLNPGNTFLIRIQVIACPVEKLLAVKNAILSFFPRGIKVCLSEKRLYPNTSTVFSGEILITPSNAGKENAVKYLLEKYAIGLQNKQLEFSRKSSVISRQSLNPEDILSIDQRPTTYDHILHAYIFGDASVDAGMLGLKDDPDYSVSSYAINPTPILEKTIEEEHDSIHILKGNSAELVRNVITGKLSSYQLSVVSSWKSVSQFSVFQSDQLKTGKLESENDLLAGKQGKQRTENRISPAQNNPARKVLQKFESLLDRLLDKNLSANEISLLGLKKLSAGLKDLYLPNRQMFQKLQGSYNYSFGNFTDILDGIRARQRKGKGESVKGKEDFERALSGKLYPSPLILNPNVIPGQLIDGFSDRVKEFLQLFMRGKKRLKADQRPRGVRYTQTSLTSGMRSSTITFLTALSCALPSIARAQVEISGKIVAEKDEKGGSMIDRTKKLFLSLFMDIIGAQNRSMAIDEEIYSKNMETFKNRLDVIARQSASGGRTEARYSLAPGYARTIRVGKLSDFQLNALERWLLYIDVLQQEDIIIKKYLIKYPNLFKEYKKESLNLAKEYLSLNLGKLRKKWNLKDWKLKVQDYL